MSESTDRPIVKCASCATERSSPAKRSGDARLPRGWILLGGQLLCGSCHVTRAVTVPVAGPVTDDGESQAEAWLALRTALREAWGDTTRAANWMATQLYMRDQHRQEGDAKLAARPRTYLYPEARSLFRRLSAQAIASLEQHVTQTYQAQRFALIWRHERSLATHRYPVPYPVPSQAWRIEETEGGQMLISLPISGRRFTLRLRGGHEYRRQREMLRRVILGEIHGARADLYERTAHEGDHRPAIEPGRQRKQLVVKVAVRMRRNGPDERRSGRLIVRTEPGVFWRAYDGEREWRFHGQHLQRRLATEAKQRRELADDLKLERRRPRREKEGMQRRLEQISERSRNALSSFTHEMTAQVVGIAARNRVAEIEVDTTYRGFVTSFPWYQLVERLRQKADLHGIAVIVTGDSSGEGPHGSAGSLAGGDSEGES